MKSIREDGIGNVLLVKETVASQVPELNGSDAAVVVVGKDCCGDDKRAPRPRPAQPQRRVGTRFFLSHLLVSSFTMMGSIRSNNNNNIASAVMQRRLAFHHYGRSALKARQQQGPHPQGQVLWFRQRQRQQPPPAFRMIPRSFAKWTAAEEEEEEENSQENIFTGGGNSTTEDILTQLADGDVDAFLALAQKEEEMGTGNNMEKDPQAASSSSLPSARTAWRRIPWPDLSWDQLLSPTEQASFQEEAQKLTGANDWRPVAIMSPQHPSPVELVLVRGHLVYLKRDDVLRLPPSGVSGNKARKFFALTSSFSSSETFPAAIVSYGGPQSNAMVALAAIVHSQNQPPTPSFATPVSDSTATATTTLHDLFPELDVSIRDEIDGYDKNENEDKNDTHEQHGAIPSTPEQRHRFIYYTKKLPKTLRKHPTGNLLRARTLGMELVELSHEEYHELFGVGVNDTPPPKVAPPVPGDSVWIPQGGSCGVAVAGAQLLAFEIFSFWQAQLNPQPLAVCLPGGTCTTALLLQRELNRLLVQQQKDRHQIRVVVIPSVGDDAYAMKQMLSLEARLLGSFATRNASPHDDDDDKDNVPDILAGDYFRFGVPHSDLLQTYLELKDDYGVYIDLLYGAPSWSLLLKHLDEAPKQSPLEGREIMYVHTGGLEGVSSQLQRYQHEGLLSAAQVQPP